jgi:hypothetical protein
VDGAYEEWRGRSEVVGSLMTVLVARKRKKTI